MSLGGCSHLPVQSDTPVHTVKSYATHECRFLRLTADLKAKQSACTICSNCPFCVGLILLSGHVVIRTYQLGRGPKRCKRHLVGIGSPIPGLCWLRHHHVRLASRNPILRRVALLCCSWTEMGVAATNVRFQEQRADMVQPTESISERCYGVMERALWEVACWVGS